MRRKKPHDYIRQAQEAFILAYLRENGVTHLRDRRFHDAFQLAFGGNRRADGGGIPVDTAMVRLRYLARRGLVNGEWVYAPERRRLEYRLAAKSITASLKGKGS